jgi:hypothetical protein
LLDDDDDEVEFGFSEAPRGALSEPAEDEDETMLEKVETAAFRTQRRCTQTPQESQDTICAKGSILPEVSVTSSSLVGFKQQAQTVSS